MPSLLDIFFKIADGIEGVCRKAQGKGYGASSIKSEYCCALRLMNSMPALIVDVGANIGDYTAEIRSITTDAEVHAFEPSKANMSFLKERFKSDSKVNLVIAALADNSGSAVLFANHLGSVFGSLSKRDMSHRNINFDQEEVVPVIRFEDYWNQHLQRRHIDFVKLDIEGHELSALKGFGESISHIDVVQFEFGSANIDTRTYFKEFWNFFRQHDFELARITPFGLQKIRRYHENDEFFWTTNYVAYRTRPTKI
jgi:FkbM family methyltransferase